MQNPAQSGGALPPTGGTPATVTQIPASPDERKDYDQALALLRDGRYTDAADAFQTFLQKYPQSEYADNAQYWLGEVYYVTRQFPLAQEAFGRVRSDYAESTKSGDALLKTGYIQYELKQWSKARATLNQVVKDYPGSTAARLADERLQRMKSEGH
jgi:tol-pal system protein YbgF